MTAALLLNEDAVYAGLDYPGCIAVMRETMADFSASGIAMPLREIYKGNLPGMFATMPGILLHERGFGAKLVSVFPDPAASGRSRHKGVITLFDHMSGALLAIADAESVTTIRTAAASAMATDCLARPDAHTLAVFGYGTQAKAHVRAMLNVRPLEKILIWGRSAVKAEMLANELARETGVAVVACPDPREAAQADILCTVTSSTTPVLFGEWVRPGTHVNLVGSSYAGPVEIDDALLLKARYIVDSRASVLAAGSEFIMAKARGLVDETCIAAEIGEVVRETAAGRTDARQITIYKSLGHVVQDLAAVRYLYDHIGETDTRNYGWR